MASSSSEDRPTSRKPRVSIPRRKRSAILSRPSSSRSQSSTADKVASTNSPSPSFSATNHRRQSLPEVIVPKNIRALPSSNIHRLLQADLSTDATSRDHATADRAGTLVVNVSLPGLSSRPREPSTQPLKPDLTPAQVEAYRAKEAELRSRLELCGLLEGSRRKSSTRRRHSMHFHATTSSRRSSDAT